MHFSISEKHSSPGEKASQEGFALACRPKADSFSSEKAFSAGSAAAHKPKADSSSSGKAFSAGPAAAHKLKAAFAYSAGKKTSRARSVLDRRPKPGFSFALFIFFFLCLCSLTACQSSERLVLKTKTANLTQEDFLRQVSYFEAIDRAKELSQFQNLVLPDAALETGEKADSSQKTAAEGEESSSEDPIALQEEKQAEAEKRAQKEESWRKLLNTLAYEELVQADPMTRSLDIQGRAKQLNQEAEERLGGEEGIRSQLENAEISRELWENSLTREAMVQLHREAFERSQPADEETLRKYARKQGNQAGLLTFIDVTLPARSIALELEESLAQDEINVEELDNRFNHDLFQRTSFQMIRDAGQGDPAVFDPALYDQAPGTVVRYYHDDLFHVVKMLEKKTDFADIQDHLKKLYLDESYLKYINKLAVNQHLRLYPDHLPFVALDRRGE